MQGVVRLDGFRSARHLDSNTFSFSFSNGCTHTALQSSMQPIRPSRQIQDVRMIRNGRLGIPHQGPAASDLQILPTSLLGVLDRFGEDQVIRHPIARHWRAKICEWKGDSTFASDPALHLHDRKHRQYAITTSRDKTSVSYTHLRAHETDSYLVC